VTARSVITTLEGFVMEESVRDLARNEDDRPIEILDSRDTLQIIHLHHSSFVACLSHTRRIGIIFTNATNRSAKTR